MAQTVAPEDGIAVYRNHSRKAFTLVEIMIVVLIIGILMTVAVPNFITARASSRRSSCVANLKEIDSLKEQFAMETRQEDGDPVTWANLVPTFMKAQPGCPGGGSYTINPVGTNPDCTLSAIGHVIP